MSGKNFRILSIDGGGVRGIIPTHILQCMTQQQEICLEKHVDMIAGTSTGAITAAAVACGFQPGIVETLYCEHVVDIFTPRTSVLPTKFMKSCVNSIYKSESLKEILDAYFGDRRLGDVKVPLLLPVTDIEKGEIHILKSGYTTEDNRDLEVRVSEAVLASCASPVFFSPVELGTTLVADGGLWAYNPALVAVLEAVRQFGVRFADLRILSMGTGRARNYYANGLKKRWGVVTGWEGGKLIEMLVALHANATLNYLEQLLQPGQLLRIDFDTEFETELDDCRAIDSLILQADSEYNRFRSAIGEFFA